MKRTQQYVRGQTIDKIVTERNLTLPYKIIPGENRNLKLGIVLQPQPLPFDPLFILK